MAVAGGKAIDGVLTLFMALLSFVESAPRAYRLKAGNAASPISTFAGAIPPINRIPDLFKKIQDGQAPDRVTQLLLKDWGFKSTNDRAFVPLLKALGFLTSDGTPTPRYLEYRDHSRSKQVLGQALKETYEDIFLIKEHPTTSDRSAIEGKFKSYHNVSDNLAGLMAKTFFALLPLAELSSKGVSDLPKGSSAPQHEQEMETHAAPSSEHRRAATSLHYNIQIHLPASKDVEVYNAIFKSLKEQLVS